MTADYAGLFGYSQEELEENFAEYIDKGCSDTGLTREKYLQELKDKYDGYRFSLEIETRIPYNKGSLWRKLQNVFSILRKFF